MQDSSPEAWGHTSQGIKDIHTARSLTLSSKTRNLLIIFLLVGIASFLVAWFKEPQRAWYSFLLNYFYFLCLGLSGLFFTALHHATRSTWSVTVRRVAEGVAAFLPVAALLSVFLLIGAKHLYSWAFPTFTTGHPLHYEGQAVPGGRLVYLNLPTFSLRTGLFFITWMAFALFLVRNSLRQDWTGDPGLTKNNVKLSMAFLPIFALTFSLACFDMLMSLEPRWYSTMFAVYCFAGLFQAGIALLAVQVILLRRRGALAEVINPAHYKDLGGLLFAFSIFVAYIGFSQFMLIWYGNMPEETFYFLRRLDGAWLLVALALPLFKFFIPFFALLSQDAKRNEKNLLTVSVLVLIGEWLDIYWMVVPVFKETPALFSWAEIGVGLGFLGLFGLTWAWFFRRYSLIPVGDPRLVASANWQG